MKRRLFLLTLALAVLGVVRLQAEIRLPKVIGDNMVLQQGKDVAVWGYADPGETVTVKFARQTKRAKADMDGKWMVRLDPMTASKKPAEMTISGRKEKVALKNILVGEVWLASGQSNMEYSMNNHPKYSKPGRGDKDILEKEFKAADNPIIRVLFVEKRLNTDELPTTGWHGLSEESLAPVSAAGYFFAKKLVEELDVPVGIISSSWGGAMIEFWTPEEAYRNSPEFSGDMEGNTLDGSQAGRYYDKMIEPQIPYTLRGFLWYQGESNLMIGDILRYADKQKVLVDSWRSGWGDETMPFYYVQLAPYSYSTRRGDRVVSTWEALPRFWEAQTLSLDIPYTGQVVVTDLVDNPRDIHPPYKWVVGERLARLALAKDYGKDIEYSGPVFRRMTLEGDKAILEFDHAEELATRDGKAPDWFQVRSSSGRLVKPEAVIDGNKIVLTVDKGAKMPLEVYFAWDELAMPNLVNKDGLPAVPFRTNPEKWSYK